MICEHVVVTDGGVSLVVKTDTPSRVQFTALPPGEWTALVSRRRHGGGAGEGEGRQVQRRRQHRREGGGSEPWRPLSLTDRRYRGGTTIVRPRPAEPPSPPPPRRATLAAAAPAEPPSPPPPPPIHPRRRRPHRATLAAAAAAAAAAAVAPAPTEVIGSGSSVPPRPKRPRHRAALSGVLSGTRITAGHSAGYTRYRRTLSRTPGYRRTLSRVSRTAGHSVGTPDMTYPNRLRMREGGSEGKKCSGCTSARYLIPKLESSSAFGPFYFHY